MEDIQNGTATMELEVPFEETELQPTSDSTSVIGVQDMEVDAFLSPSQVSDECTSINAAANSADENDTESSEEEG